MQEKTSRAAARSRWGVQPRQPATTTPRPVVIEPAIQPELVLTSPTPPKPPKPPKKAIPYDEIIALYHEHMPDSPRVRKAGKKLLEQIRSRWKDDEERQDLEWWDYYFRYANTRLWLTGRKCSKDGSTFMANLMWLTGIENMEKVTSDYYDGEDPEE